MLYNRKTVLAWYFIKIGKVKKKVTGLQKRGIVDHKAWKTLGFLLSKALISTVIDILQKRQKIGVIETCHGPYRNF